MKNLIYRIAILAIALFLGSANAQTINWASMKEENKHIIDTIQKEVDDNWAHLEKLCA